ncbi:MAG: hypothetical protein ACK4SF_13700 [Algoriphagus aquaeductus]|uniref:hypothetical protein n=1 Tax=Algoriphagus TaxID=246875 RepID=UPI00258E6FF8|nr:hypothetical protein [Algoriphagus sp.]
MKKCLFVLVFWFSALSGFAQIKFFQRHEIPSTLSEPIYEIMRIPGGLVSFRTFQAKSFSAERVFQFYKTDFNLKSGGLNEVAIKSGYDMIGYDTDQENLYILLSRGFNSGADKYILQIDLQSNQGIEFPADNLLPLDLIEFLVLDSKAVFMGNAEGRPVLQILNLENKSLHTVQGIYGNNTQVLQIRKMAELQALEVVVNRRGQYKSRETSILTFDMMGNLLREVKVDQFGEQGQEIMDGVLLADQNFQQVMIGSFGLMARNSYQGMYVLEINEFGEYEFKLYTLEDFPNFYNYMSEKRKAKQDAAVLNDLEKGKIPNIRYTYVVRDVWETEDSFVVYFDQLNILTSRGGGRGAISANNAYRYDRINRLGYVPYYMDPFVSPNMPMQSFSLYTEYQYQSAHFVKVAKTGQVLWDNAASYRDFSTNYPEPFGEMAVVGEDLFHLYTVNDQIRASFFRNGEKVFENMTFDLVLPDENGRVKSTDSGSLRLVHWYDRYFLLSGKQTVRYLNAQNMEEIKEVFFMDKILVDGDLYQPEESRD